MSETSPNQPVELGPFAARVIGWMDVHGISGREMAKRCKLSPSYFTTLRSGKTGVPSMRTIEAISKVMGEDLFPYAMMLNPGDELKVAQRIEEGRQERARAQANKHANAAAGPPNAFHAPDVPTEALAAQIYMPLDVPVLGVSMGGDDSYFHFNGETVDYVRRPLGIAKAKRAYATFVTGDSMYPLYSEGSIVYVNPDKPPAIGDDVVLEIDMGPNEPTAGYIKRLKRRTSERIIVEQFNPSKEIEFDRNVVVAMHRVVPWNELLAI